MNEIWEQQQKKPFKFGKSLSTYFEDLGEPQFSVESTSVVTGTVDALHWIA